MKQGLLADKPAPFYMTSLASLVYKMRLLLVLLLLGNDNYLQNEQHTRYDIV